MYVTNTLYNHDHFEADEDSDKTFKIHVIIYNTRKYIPKVLSPYT